jgi:redox-sensitive bicupin YhaK (pirin superfamily)
MTAGKGVVHGEMFPLVHKDKPNHTKFFQIWLNLPKVSKMVDPAFRMVSYDVSIFRGTEPC